MASAPTRYNYAALRTYIEGGRTKTHRPMHKRCLSVRLDNDPRDPGAQPRVVLRMYHTDIVTFYPDGRREVRANGWWTSPTTKANITEALQNALGHGRFGIYTTNRAGVSRQVRLYAGPEFPLGLPAVDGVIYDARGQLVYHPHSPDGDPRNTEEVVVKINRALPHVKLRYAQRRELLKAVAPMMPFIDKANLPEVMDWPFRSWLLDKLDNGVPPQEAMLVALQLVANGAPKERYHSWQSNFGRSSEFNPDKVKYYFQNALSSVWEQIMRDEGGFTEFTVRSADL